MITSIFLVLAAGSAQAATDFLTQSKAGKFLCANPDTATKTCSSISTFRVSANGSTVETTESLINPAPPITLTMSIATEVDGSSNCGVMTLADLQRGQVRVNGEALPSDRNALALKKLEAAFGSFFGKRACDAIRMENGALVKYGQIEGVDIKLPGKPVLWISSEDGYKVAPR